MDLNVIIVNNDYHFFHMKVPIETRTKTSIRYAKENDREKRERRREREKGRRRDIERCKGYRKRE